MLGLAIIILLVLIALYTSIFWDYNTMIVKVNIPERVQPPSPVHPFGTDDMGRDVLIRTLYGTRYSLIIGFGATAIGLIIGVLLGAVAFPRRRPLNGHRRCWSW
jgi:peptide/nickel transport system permease protein